MLIKRQEKNGNAPPHLKQKVSLLNARGRPIWQTSTMKLLVVVIILIVANYLDIPNQLSTFTGVTSKSPTARRRWSFTFGNEYTNPNDIPCKIQQALTNFNEKRTRQSKSISEARQAYQKRYKRNPPRLFNIWADFALQHNSQVIDEYDQIEIDLKPFRRTGINRSAWHKIISAAKRAEPGEMLGSLSIVDGVAIAIGPLKGTMSVHTLEGLIAPFAPLLPDMNILFNWFAEPRVLASSSVTEGVSDTNGITPSYMHFVNYSGQSTMDLLTSSCPYNGLAKITGSKDVTSRDFCRQAQENPEMEQWHGFYKAPDRFHPTRSLFPLLSRAKLSVFDDILAPNVCYGHTDYRVWGENDTIAFTQKHRDIYWRGSMTGISMTPSNWVYGQRHRLVRYAQSMREYITGQVEGTPFNLYEPFFSSAPWKGSVSTSLSRLTSDALNVGFSGTGRGTDPKVTNEIKKEHPLKSRDAPNEAFRHQFVLDVDGQSMSCRFYSLLESNAVVFKQTIWAEWHDDRLIPWIHYIPIDIDLSRHEIPLYLDWFLNSDKGQEYAEIVARESRSWAEQSLRSIDLTIYLFRILIEIDSIMK
jgi:hypothetical protein